MLDSVRCAVLKKGIRMADNIDTEVDNEEEFPFEFPDPEEIEVVTVSVVGDERGRPQILLNGNVDSERAALLLQMAAQMSLENTIFDYLPGVLDGVEEAEEEAEEEETVKPLRTLRKVKDVPQA